MPDHNSKGGRVSFDEALAIVHEQATPLPAIQMPLHEALGAVLAEDAAAGADYPRFDMSAMDGFAMPSALTATACETVPLDLQVNGAAFAGHAAEGHGPIWQINTGARIPRGCDTVVPKERVNVIASSRGVALQLSAPLNIGANIRRHGEDAAAGEAVLRRGERIDAARLGALACFGTSSVCVATIPKLAVIPTGDELISAGATANHPAVFDSNGPMVAAQACEAGAHASLFVPVRDNPQEIELAVRRAMAQDADIVITTGGVSVGERDHIGQVLGLLCAQIHFHGVYMRPGKPMVFATLPNGTLFFGLPGNPVAAYLGFRFFVYAAVRAMRGLPREIGEPIDISAPSRPGTTVFLAARRWMERGRSHVEILPGQQSHRMRPLLSANAWLRLPPSESAQANTLLYPLLCAEVA